MSSSGAARTPSRSGMGLPPRKTIPASPAVWSSTRPTRTPRWTPSTTWKPSQTCRRQPSSGTDRAMTTTIVLQQAINGVVLGSLYVLVALGLTLIYGVLVQINFAHADFVTLGAFAAYFFMHLVGGGYILSIAVAFAVGAALGWLINASIFTPLRHKGNELLPLIATIGVSVMMQNLMLAWFGPIPYAFETTYSSEVIRFAGIFVSWQNVIIIIVSTLTIALLYAFMRFTFLGKALRAVAQDRETAGLMGINPNHLIMLTFVIASALAGMGGAMLAPVLVLTPFAGTSVIVKAFAIVIIGGVGDVEGTPLSPLLLGPIANHPTPILYPRPLPLRRAPRLP